MRLKLSDGGIRPSCSPPAKLASFGKRCTHLMAEDSLTPKRAAAARRLIPPRTTASITRSRKSCRICSSSLLASRPASRLKSQRQCRDLGNPNRFKLDAACSSERVDENAHLSPPDVDGGG